MKSRRNWTRSLLLVAVGVLALSAPQSESRTSDRASDADQGAIAGLRPETRLRKLHLVRPDLIPYPIAYEVYC